MVKVITSNRTYFLSADTTEIMQEWYDAIESSLSELNKNGDGKSIPDGFRNDENVSDGNFCCCKLSMIINPLPLSI